MDGDEVPFFSYMDTNGKIQTYVWCNVAEQAWGMKLKMLRGFRYPGKKTYVAYSLSALNASHDGEIQDIKRDAWGHASS